MLTDVFFLRPATAASEGPPPQKKSPPNPEEMCFWAPKIVFFFRFRLGFDKCITESKTNGKAFPEFGGMDQVE